MSSSTSVNNIGRKVGLALLMLSAIGVGVYPIMFLSIPENQGLFSTKSAALLANTLYMVGFYTHISFGGLALISGFSQFFPGLRKKRLGLHRTLGKVYVIAVLLSGMAGLGIALKATGGWVSVTGFSLLAIFWLVFTILAYSVIRKGDILQHQKWMIRSYALCFGAVTLRIYLPLSMAMDIDFMVAYPIIAWLAWVPNLIVAELAFVRPLNKRNS